MNARPMSPRGRRGAERGFTLLEVIVALVIAGFALAAMLGAIEAGLSSQGRTDRALRVLSIARSQLDGALAAGTFRPGTQTYDIPPHYHSTVDIRQLASGTESGERQVLGLYSVVVRVWADGSSRSVTLEGQAAGRARAQ